MKNTLLIVVCLVLVNIVSFGQITVNTGSLTPAQYVQNVLIGNGVTVSNITYSGLSSQIGSFNGSASNIGFQNGVVLSSGDVSTIPGAAINDPIDQMNGGGDPDLLLVAQSVTSNPNSSFITSTEDAAVLEFDFIPTSNTVSFNFVFASDEYLTWINSQYNDAFGFFVSGPGITGPFSAPAGFPNGSQNLAVVPGTTTPITISTIQPSLNSNYFIDNANGTTQSFNGFTTQIPITINVQCAQTYHFKFAVADCQDQTLNTAVFLEAGSFTSPPVDLQFVTSNGTNHVVEGCANTTTEIEFTRNTCTNADSLRIDMVYSGSAIEGTDYATMPPTVYMVPGQDTLLLPFTTFSDLLAEGSETVIITITAIGVNGDTVVVSEVLFIDDLTPLVVNVPDKLLKCLNDSIAVNATTTGGGQPISLLWSTGQTGNTINVTSSTNGVFQYSVIATDLCGNIAYDTMNLTVNQTLAIDTMIANIASACVNDGTVQGFETGITGQPQFHWEGPNTNGPSQVNASVLQNIGPGWYVFSITDNVCSVLDSVYLDSKPAPLADFSPSTTSGCNPLNVTFTNNGQNGTTYAWDFGNGVTNVVGNLSAQNQTFSLTSTVKLIVTDGPCKDTAYATITVVNCGCTNPIAINYDPLASVDDGSCFFPVPTVIAPNVFTPNGDLENPLFKLDVTNTVDIQIRITNRWGGLVYEGSGLSIGWDGKFNGSIVDDGVYFYEYTVTGVAGDKIDGSGFVQVFANK